MNDTNIVGKFTTEISDIQTHTNTKTHKCLCVSCTLPIEDEEEQKWAEEGYKCVEL
jgi:hypothetical protein